MFSRAERKNGLTSSSELTLEPPAESPEGGERCEVSADPGFEIAGRSLKERTLAAGSIPLESCSFEHRLAEERGQEKIKWPTLNCSRDAMDEHGV